MLSKDMYCIFVLQVADYMELPDLSQYLTNIINKEPFLNEDLTQKVLQVRSQF